MSQRVYDLEDRIIDFSSRVIDVTEALPDNKAALYIAGQMLRAGIAPSLLYGEAQGAESRSDFVHKMKVVLKELKETRVCLKLIFKRKFILPPDKLGSIMLENEELIAIVAKSIETAKANLELEKRGR